jgi:hypothetical protein
LPRVISLYIFSYLDPASLSRASQVSVLHFYESFAFSGNERLYQFLMRAKGNNDR